MKCYIGFCTPTRTEVGKKPLEESLGHRSRTNPRYDLVGYHCYGVLEMLVSNSNLTLYFKLYCRNPHRVWCRRWFRDQGQLGIHTSSLVWNRSVPTSKLFKRNLNGNHSISYAIVSNPFRVPLPFSFSILIMIEPCGPLYILCQLQNSEPCSAL